MPDTGMATKAFAVVAVAMLAYRAPSSLPLLLEWALAGDPWRKAGWALVVVAMLGGLSTLLLHAPSLLHLPKRTALMDLRFCAHRGGAAEQPENTLAAFRAAAAAGATAVTVDARLGAGGDVVVLCDPTAARTCGVATPAAELRAAELPQLLSSLAPPAPFSHSQAAPVANPDGARVCTLREVFDAHPHLCVCIHVRDAAAPTRIAALVAEHDRRGRTVWGSADAAIARRCWEADPDIPLFGSCRSVALTVAAYWTGLLPFLPVRESVWAVPYPTPQLRAAATTWLQPRCGAWAAGRLAALAFDAPLNRGLLRHLQSRGVQVVVGVLNEGDSIAECGRRRFSGIATDRPTALRKLVGRSMKIASLI